MLSVIPTIYIWFKTQTQATRLIDTCAYIPAPDSPVQLKKENYLYMCIGGLKSKTYQFITETRN